MYYWLPPRNDYINPAVFLTFFFHLQTLEFVDPFRPYQSFDTLKRFLQFDGKVLRFFCLWDDSHSLFGDRRELVLHYFLSDDTIEIRELLSLNSGRDAMSSFLRRGKLPKVSSLRMSVDQETCRSLFGMLCDGSCDTVTVCYLAKLGLLLPC